MKNFVWESFFRLAVEKYSYLYVDYISRDISRGLCEFLCQYLIINLCDVGDCEIYWVKIFTKKKLS